MSITTLSTCGDIGHWLSVDYTLDEDQNTAHLITYLSIKSTLDRLNTIAEIIKSIMLLTTIANSLLIAWTTLSWALESMLGEN